MFSGEIKKGTLEWNGFTENAIEGAKTQGHTAQKNEVFH